ncbi:MAG: glycosyltransferase [Bacteriovorax sp.]|nr:glycosyltransferase [Bacteriovorax sp.]
MNLLMITVRTDLGGGPKHILDLIKVLKTTKRNFYLASPLTLPFGPLLKSEFKDHFELPSRSFNFIVFLNLLKFVKKHQIGIVHSHGRGAGVYARLLYFFGIKVVHTFHGIHQDKSITGRIKFLFDFLSSPFVDHYIYCSIDEKLIGEKLHLTFKRKYSVINNGISLNNFQCFDESDRPVLTMGVMARNDYQKGLDILFKNLLFLVEKKIHFKFLIAGIGKNEIIIPNELSNIVMVQGQFDNPVKFLSQLDLYVSHSRWEGLPLSVLEAMALKIPCLLSNVTGHHYFIENQVAFGFELASRESFFEVFSRFSENNEAKTQLATLARSFILEHHDVIKMGQKTALVYDSLSSIA